MYLRARDDTSSCLLTIETRLTSLLPLLLTLDGDLGAVLESPAGAVTDFLPLLHRFLFGRL